MAYTSFDRFVAQLRFRAALPHIREQSKVCDLGCGLDAAFLTYAGSKIVWGTGLDDQVRAGGNGRWPLVCGNITRTLPLLDQQFDHVVMLAVLEHLSEPEPVLTEAFRILLPGGSLVITWPQSLVDPLLFLLHRVGLVSKEMESQEHQRRIPLQDILKMLTRIGFNNFYHRRFEFGLNNLLVAFRPINIGHLDTHRG
jgi:ubiquinone/menaquinone biosynthesis C-methylase UbiE